MKIVDLFVYRILFLFFGVFIIWVLLLEVFIVGFLVNMFLFFVLVSVICIFFVLLFMNVEFLFRMWILIFVDFVKDGNEFNKNSVKMLNKGRYCFNVGLEK